MRIVELITIIHVTTLRSPETPIDEFFGAWNDVKTWSGNDLPITLEFKFGQETNIVVTI